MTIDSTSPTVMLQYKKAPDFSELSKYFIPIALQSAAQSITYPLVAIVATNGTGGPLELAGMAQSNAIMFLLSTIGAGLVTTGMVFAKDIGGYRKFVKVNYLLATIAFILQGICVLPYISHWIFSSIMGLPPSIEPYSIRSLIATMPLNLLFFMRGPYQIVLYLNKATALASVATIARIVCTFAIAPLFCYFKLTGVAWASVALSIGVLVEVILSRLFSRPYMRVLEQNKITSPTIKELLAFTLPLSVGGLFLSISGVIIGMVIARAAHAEQLLPVFYLAIGIANPMSAAASRIQTLTIVFPPDRNAKRNTIFWYTILSGTILGFIPLLFIFPGIVQLYYVTMQNCPPKDLNLVRQTALALVLLPIGVAIRAHFEGVAAHLRKSIHILFGQGVFMGVLSVSAILFLFLHVPGNIIGPAAYFVSNTASAIVIIIALNWSAEREEEIEIIKSPNVLGEVEV